jgi:hypothetical protein
VEGIDELGTTWLVNVNVPKSLILSTLMMQAIHSSETSVIIRTTWRHILGDGIIHAYGSFVSFQAHVMYGING